MVVLDEANGEELSRVSMPKRNLPVFPLAVNRDLVMVVNGPHVCLDRRNGKHKYNVDLPSTVAGGLTADLHQCFIVLSNNRVISVGLNPEDVRTGMRFARKSMNPKRRPASSFRWNRPVNCPRLAIYRRR